jgi:hypothetical protein
MARYSVPRDPFDQFLGSVAADLDFGIADDATIVEHWCKPLSERELRAFLGSLDDRIRMRELPWQQIIKDSNRHFRTCDDVRAWLVRIRSLVAVQITDRGQKE